MTANELINLLDRAVKLLEDDNKRIENESKERNSKYLKNQLYYISDKKKERLEDLD